jgi:hypothetical protein
MKCHRFARLDVQKARPGCAVVEELVRRLPGVLAMPKEMTSKEHDAGLACVNASFCKVFVS